MKLARDIIGLPVMCTKTGKQAGVVKDLLFDEEWKLHAAALETKHWFSEDSCILHGDIAAFGEDAVMIGDTKAIRPLQPSGDGFSLLEGTRKLRGLPVLTANGLQLGIIEDVCLDSQHSNHIAALELTDGFISDLRDGRKRLPMPKSITAGEDAVIVPAGAGEAVEQFRIQ